MYFCLLLSAYKQILDVYVCNKLIWLIIIQFLRFCSLFDQRAMFFTFCQGHRSSFKLLYIFRQSDPASSLGQIFPCDKLIKDYTTCASKNFKLVTPFLHFHYLA